jgi:hypothetical protein
MKPKKQKAPLYVPKPTMEEKICWVACPPITLRESAQLLMTWQIFPGYREGYVTWRNLTSSKHGKVSFWGRMLTWCQLHPCIPQSPSSSKSKIFILRVFINVFLFFPHFCTSMVKQAILVPFHKKWQVITNKLWCIENRYYFIQMINMRISLILIKLKIHMFNMHSNF